MATVSTPGHGHVEPIKPFMIVWGFLLAFTAVEVILAYQQFELKTMLVMLMTLSIIKAALIIAFFMHLRYDRHSLAWTLMPALVFVILMMFVVFPDSVRLYLMRPK
ncbi:MAG TPA: cytochrome C oxidase subunit IV family protein [Terriglobia bacterium]|nr:cytochrome C oxidase subunit IV family protein [Terriglobia bacterium]